MYKNGDLLLCRFGSDGHYFLSTYKSYIPNYKYHHKVKYIINVHVDNNMIIKDTHNPSIRVRNEIINLSDREVIRKITNSDKVMAMLI